MKHLLYTISAVGLSLLNTPVTAQDNNTYKGNITISPLELRQKGDSLYVALDFKINGINVNSRHSVDFVPLLVSDRDNRSIELPKVSVKGRNNYKSYKRSQALMSKREYALYKAPYSIVKGYKKKNDMLEYRYVMPYEPWMESARLDIQKDVCGCGKANMIAMQRLVDNVSTEKTIIIEPYLITPHLAYKKPEIEAVKSRELQNESFLDFAVSKTIINPDFGNNPMELAKIRRMIEEVKDDKDVTIRKISIIGYASPEGSLSLNKRLSEGRAKAMQGYLQSRYDLPASLYSVTFGGEDWDGLLKQVEASDISYKQEILDIIQNTSIDNGRETKLMALQGGIPYKYMLKEMFPALRRVMCKVDYDVKQFSLTQAKDIVKSRPQNLSLNEMYMVSEEYEQGSEEFNDLFETAVRLFPNDETANLNAAASALSRKDLVSAEKYLSKVKTKMRIPEYDNSMGVLMMLKGDYDKAEQYLKAAQQAGVEIAKTNLEELGKKRESVKEINNAELKNRNVK